MTRKGFFALFAHLTWVSFSLSAQAEQTTCVGLAVQAEGSNSEETELICDAARSAKKELDRYDIAFPELLKIKVVAEFDVNCVGIYHCGENLIELLTLDALHKMRSPNSIFKPMATKEYFSSIVLHEIVHAAYDTVDCPFQSCMATSEYLAYALQINALAPDARDAVAQGIDPDAPVSRDELNVVILMMAPDVFGLKAWSHFAKRPDPKTFVTGIMDGTILMDRFHP